MPTPPDATRTRTLTVAGTARPAGGKSRDPLFAAASDAFERADYDVVDALVTTAPVVSKAQTGRMRLLEARLARIRYEFERWYVAAGAAAADLADPADRVLATVLQAIAAKRLGKRDEYEHAIADAERRAGRMNAADAAVASYLIALDAWEADDYEKAEALLRRNVEARANVAESTALIGWVHARRERWDLAGKAFIAALDAYHEFGETNVRLHARLVHSASIAASETIDLAAAGRVRDEYERVAWRPSLNDARFDTVACLRYLALLEGDFARAATLSRDAIAFATSPAFEAMGETNAAVASRLLGDEKFHEVQLARAWTILRSTSWSKADDDARVALTNFAIEATSTMPAEARQAITIYQSLGSKPNPTSGFSGQDRRIDAFSAVAAARVAELLDDRELAIGEYQKALEIWSAIGFGMRAALAALDLRRLTGSAKYQGAIDAALERAPHAWFGDGSARAGAALPPLTPAERTVLVGLLAGKSAKAIAVSLKRSHFTINNHTRKIFAGFGVNSRAQLLARCVELGITQAMVERTL
jgi:DNA-binding CsgD family transcriptional regulator